MYIMKVSLLLQDITSIIQVPHVNIIIITRYNSHLQEYTMTISLLLQDITAIIQVHYDNSIITTGYNSHYTSKP